MYFYLVIMTRSCLIVPSIFAWYASVLQCLPLCLQVLQCEAQIGGFVERTANRAMSFCYIHCHANLSNILGCEAIGLNSPSCHSERVSPSMSRKRSGCCLLAMMVCASVAFFASTTSPRCFRDDLERVVGVVGVSVGVGSFANSIIKNSNEYRLQKKDQESKETFRRNALKIMKVGGTVFVAERIWKFFQEKKHTDEMLNIEKSESDQGQNRKNEEHEQSMALWDATLNHQRTETHWMKFDYISHIFGVGVLVFLSLWIVLRDLMHWGPQQHQQPQIAMWGRCCPEVWCFALIGNQGKAVKLVIFHKSWCPLILCGQKDDFCFVRIVNAPSLMM